MQCPRETLLIRLISGELDGMQADDLRSHLEACTVCRESLRALQETATLLGAWEVDVTGTDLVPGVRSMLERDREHPLELLWFRIRQSVALRAAASVVLATGLGVAAGHLVLRATPRPPVHSAETVAPEAVIEALGLSAFTTDSVTGLVPNFEASSREAGDAAGE